MITAPLLTQGVKVDLPETGSDPLQSDQQEPLIVTVDADGKLYLNIGDSPETPIDDAALIEKVSVVLRRRQDQTVLVRGDHAVDYGAVIAAMVLLQQAGVPHVGLVTEPPQ